MNPNNLRYIVFLLDDAVQKYMNGLMIEGIHDGKIFTNPTAAHEFAIDAVENKECKRFVVGEFYLDPYAQTMSIQRIETFGFKKDKANPNQLNLFNINKF